MQYNSTKKRKAEDEPSEVHHPYKKRKIEFDLETNFALPSEIMLQIFENLPPTAFSASAVVCKYWYECAAIFGGWIRLGEAHYNLDLTKNGELAFLESVVVDLPSSIIADRTIVETSYHASFSVHWTGSACTRQTTETLTDLDFIVQILHSSGRVLASVNFNIDQMQIRTVIEEYLKANKCVHCPEWRIDALLFRQTDAVYGGTKYFATFRLHLSAKALQTAVDERNITEFPCFNLIYKYGVQHDAADLIEDGLLKFRRLNTSLIPCISSKIKPIKGLKEGFKWHKYQLDCISWMKSIEENVDKEFKYCDLLPWRASRANLLFDLYNKKVVFPEDADDYIGSFKSRGGILADAVGLGKTLEIIGLVLATQDKKLPEFDENGLFNTKASLIICSSHIALQWASEITKFTNLKVTLVSSAKEAAEVTYGDVIDSDFVIVASSLLKNKSYLSIGCTQNIVSLAPKLLTVRTKYLQDRLVEVKKKKNRRSIAEAPIDNFHFKRIIVDEAHEVLLDDFILALLTLQTKDYCWYVSATPFAASWLFQAAKIFLGIWPADFKLQSTLGDKYEHYVEMEVIMKNLVWRNTKESIKDEYDVPDYNEEVVWIDCHPIEARFYKTVNLKYTHKANELYLKSALDDYKDQCINELRRRYAPSEDKIAEWLNVPYVIKDQKIASKKEEERLKVLNEYGSKYAKILAWLKERIKEDESNRFLFFSKNNAYFGQLGQMWTENGISFAKFDGNVNQKAKGLKKFKEEDIKVMILSLVKSASGLNLIEANYIVLMDPMLGSVEEARAYELQALGRSHRQGQDDKVHLMRFLMKDTFEEEIYYRMRFVLKNTFEEELYYRNKSNGQLQNLTNHKL